MELAPAVLTSLAVPDGEMSARKAVPGQPQPCNRTRLVVQIVEGFEGAGLQPNHAQPTLL